MTTKNTGERRTIQLRDGDVALWRRVRAEAVLKGLSMTELVEPIIRKHLDSGKEESPKKGAKGKQPTFLEQ